MASYKRMLNFVQFGGFGNAQDKNSISGALAFRCAEQGGAGYDDPTSQAPHAAASTNNAASLDQNKETKQGQVVGEESPRSGKAAGNCNPSGVQGPDSA